MSTAARSGKTSTFSRSRRNSLVFEIYGSKSSEAAEGIWEGWEQPEGARMQGAEVQKVRPDKDQVWRAAIIRGATQQALEFEAFAEGRADCW